MSESVFGPRWIGGWHSPPVLGSPSAALVLLLVCALLGTQVGPRPLTAAERSAAFEIRVVDRATGRGVPLAELVTVDDVRHVTDNAGRIAYVEPGHAGQTIFFHVDAHGYTVPKDGLGIAGVRLKIVPGDSALVELDRVNVAERMYRCTGGGLYRDSVLLGYSPPLANPLGSGQVAGQDSVQVARYRDRLFWFWGDTERFSYPLGLFRTAGATSRLPADGGLLPAEGVNYEYFTDQDGFARAMVDVPNPEGVVWVDGVTTVADAAGRQRMVAHFSRRPGLADAYEQGILVYNDQREIFEVRAPRRLDDRWRFPSDHPIPMVIDGVDYRVFGNPFPVTRVPATLSDVLDPARYQSWSCMAPGDDPETAAPQRHPDGRLAWQWQAGPPVTQKQEARWLKSGLISPQEARYSPVDATAADDRRVRMHSGTVHWNGYRERWIMVAVEIAQDGSSPSMLGEIWYSESDSPQGPFRKAVKVVTHDEQSFYNPCHHPFFDQHGGRTIFFEGTYCNTFTESPPTQRYDYNQIMYRLDLDHPALRSVFAAASP